jgi:predicted RNase H-like HicB family nuclease
MSCSADACSSRRPTPGRAVDLKDYRRVIRKVMNPRGFVDYRSVYDYAQQEWYIAHWRSDRMKLQLTAVFERVPEGYIGYVEELPGANTQGETLDETRANLEEAVHMVLDANRALAEERLGKRDVIRESLSLTA